MSILALAFWCLGGLAVETPQAAPRAPSELPVVTFDGVPGSVGVLSATPQRVGSLPALPATALDDRPGAVELDAPRSLSLTFARPLPIRDALLLLFRGTPLSLVLEPGVSGTFVGELKNVTLRQALESVLFPAALDYSAGGTIVRVFPRRPQTRFFSIEHLLGARSGVDFAADAAAGVQGLLSADGKVHVNRKAALVQVTDFADRLDVVAAYLEIAHLRVNRQIRIQARVFEVARGDSSPIEWSALASRPGSGIRRTGGATPGWRIDDFSAWLRTIAETGPVRHIAAPAVLVMNNEPAILRAEDTAAQSEVRLTVTPQIAADGIIQMHVAPTYVEGPFRTTVDTVVRLADGDTIVIGGLMRRQAGASHAEVVVLLTAATVTPAAPTGGGER